jgi:hypothetical protein
LVVLGLRSFILFESFTQGPIISFEFWVGRPLELVQGDPCPVCFQGNKVVDCSSAYISQRLVLKERRVVFQY